MDMGKQGPIVSSSMLANHRRDDALARTWRELGARLHQGHDRRGPALGRVRRWQLIPPHGAGRRSHRDLQRPQVRHLHRHLRRLNRWPAVPSHPHHNHLAGRKCPKPRYAFWFNKTAEEAAVLCRHVPEQQVSARSTALRATTPAANRATRDCRVHRAGNQAHRSQRRTRIYPEREFFVSGRHQHQEETDRYWNAIIKTAEKAKPGWCWIQVGFFVADHPGPADQSG